MTQTTTLEAPGQPGVNKSEAAEASSAQSRINIPLNLDNWHKLPDEIQQDLLWFHQFALDQRMSLADCAQALGYDNSTIFRVLKGTYEGSYKNICEAIRSYKRLATERASIQQNEWVENKATRMIFAGLNYAMANNSIATILGESRMGKTVTAKRWRDENNHGRTVFVTAPAYGGTRRLLFDIAKCVGVNTNKSAVDVHESILRAFNRNRILIIDEAHRLLPGDRGRQDPQKLEILRDLHDRTGCALCLLATQRFDTELRKGAEYQFEQLIGRIGMPVRLPRNFLVTDIEPIVRQYVKRPSDSMLDTALGLANKPGRLGILVETLKVASRMAVKSKSTLTEEHFFKALKLRQEMMGEITFAEKN